jgi:hypothetical protein
MAGQFDPLPFVCRLSDLDVDRIQCAATARSL